MRMIVNSAREIRAADPEGGKTVSGQLLAALDTSADKRSPNAYNSHLLTFV